MLGQTRVSLEQWRSLLAVVDAYDAMTNQRPYQAAISSQAATAEIAQRRGHQFDPVIADAFARLRLK